MAIQVLSIAIKLGDVIFFNRVDEPIFQFYLVNTAKKIFELLSPIAVCTAITSYNNK